MGVQLSVAGRVKLLEVNAFAMPSSGTGGIKPKTSGLDSPWTLPVCLPDRLLSEQVQEYWAMLIRSSKAGSRNQPRAATNRSVARLARVHRSPASEPSTANMRPELSSITAKSIALRDLT